jgi:hypothetical protein
LPIVPCGEVDVLTDEATLLRRVKNHENHVTWDDIEQRWRPRVDGDAYALLFDDLPSGRREWSSYWRQHLTDRHGEDVSVVVKEGYPLVFMVGADAVRKIEYEGFQFDVDHTPEGDIPVDCAHCSVSHAAASKAVRKALRERLADMLELVWGTLSLAKPPGA